VSLKLDRSLLRQWQFLVPEVFQSGKIDDELIVQIDRNALAHHENAETVPFAEGLVGQYQRISAGGACGVIPEAATAFVGAESPLAAFLRVIPNLNLRRCPQVDATVGFGNRLVFDQQFNVAEVFVGGQVSSIAVVDQIVANHRPVLL